ncbi:uncharacterized protein LOC131145436 isoform X2 [Malania oleifera]|uniref:uncharacterized protein LOC131145436 isoform X2 n=1 Tax=Malania oleifera TaxID=397392 RepID=UPI0025AE3BDA|nr:uncharacterized protein LOC131145436 isoform X2 [Malania oleifera]
MENTLPHFTRNSTANESKNLSELCNAGASYSRDTALRIDAPTISVSHLSQPQRGKRKQGAGDKSMGLLDGSLLDLGLGHSPSSSASKGSLSSLDLSLNFNPHLGNEKIPNPSKTSCVTPKPLQVQRPKLDLELSLLTGPAKSDITSITASCCIAPNSTSFLNNVEIPVMASTVELVDEGSTSSRWKFGHLVRPLQTLQNTEITTAFDHVIGNMNKSLVVPNPLSTMVTVPKGSASSASGLIRPQQQRNSNVKTCQIEGCGKGARGASGRCIAHGGGQRCQKPGCQKGAEGKTVFCKAHGGGRRCQHLGCTKSAEGRTDFCIAHGGGRRCSHEDCTRAARGKSGLCIRHGGGKRCKVENCTKSAEGISGLCISHGGGRRCQHPACTKGAQGSTMFCKAHGGGKRCTAPGCTKGAEGSTPFCKGHGGGKRCTFEGGGVCPRSVHGGTLFCVAHGGGKRCAVPECTKSARGKTAYCVRHGGGKRCKHEGCGKSAQGSTDFCKAHGGGKRCSWGQVGLGFGDQAAGPCDKFARGKSGLCASHSAQVEDMRVHGGDTLDSTLQNPKHSVIEKMKDPVSVGKSLTYGIKTLVSGGNLVGLNDSELRGHGPQMISMQISRHANFGSEKAAPAQFSLPEGRVHGGNLMAMLRGNSGIGSSSDMLETGLNV